MANKEQRSSKEKKKPKKEKGKPATPAQTSPFGEQRGAKGEPKKK